MSEPRKIIVAMSGASGAAYGISILKLLRDVPDVESMLVMSRPAERALADECGATREELVELADRAFDNEDIGAAIASGSWHTDGMIIAPCSVRTLSAIAYGNTSNLVVRAADVTLKERRRLILMIRETPLHLGHLRAMTTVTEMGAIVMPPVPYFYTFPETVDDVVVQTAARALVLLGIETPAIRRWHPPEDGGVETD